MSTRTPRAAVCGSGRFAATDIRAPNLKAEETSFRGPAGQRGALVLHSLSRAAWDRVAVAPPSSSDALGLVVLGVELEEIERRACTTERMRVVEALAWTRTRPTPNYPDGYLVADAIATCGRQHVFKRGSSYKRAPTRCRSRPCSACARSKADVDAHALKRFVATRTEVGARIVFFTFTQPKRPRWREQPRAASDRIQSVYRAIFRAGTRVGNWARALFVGGLRSIEVTYSRKGSKQNADGSRTTFSGYHVHLHGLLEVADGIDAAEAMRWLRDAWVMYCDDASPSAQLLTLANAKRIQYVCKYVTKGMEDAARHSAVVRELYAGLSGTRLLQASGTWMGRKGKRLGWREIGDPPLPLVVAPWLIGPTIGWVVRLAMLEARPEGVTSTVVFRDRRTGDETRDDAVVVFDALVKVEHDARARAGTSARVVAADLLAQATTTLVLSDRASFAARRGADVHSKKSVIDALVGVPVRIDAVLRDDDFFLQEHRSAVDAVRRVRVEDFAAGHSPSLGNHLNLVKADERARFARRARVDAPSSARCRIVLMPDSATQTSNARVGAQFVGLDDTPTGSDPTADVVADFTGATETQFTGNVSNQVPIVATHSETLGSTFKIGVRGKWNIRAEIPVATAAQVNAAINVDGLAADFATDPASVNVRNFSIGRVLGAAATTDTIMLSADVVITQDVALSAATGMVRILLGNGAGAGATAASLAVLANARVIFTWIGDVPPGNN